MLSLSYHEVHQTYGAAAAAAGGAIGQIGQIGSDRNKADTEGIPLLFCSMQRVKCPFTIQWAI